MTKEQAKNGSQAAETGAQTEDDKSDARERSTIQFPYNDLDDAVKIAKAIHENAGVECTIDQLAGYVKQPLSSGAFRVRVSTAATFGLTDNERGSVRLTELGRHIADPAKESAARVEAFLKVPLYARIYEKHKGYMLPPPAALEKFMREVGVSSKQTDRARQAFMRSARQAGFFAHGEDRLVRPAGPGTKPIDAPKTEGQKNQRTKTGNGDGGGGPLDPLIEAVIQKLPASGTQWAADERVEWLRLLAMAFQMTYGKVEAIEIKKAEDR